MTFSIRLDRLEHAERILRGHLVLDVIERLDGRHMPVGGASGQQLDEREAFAVNLVLERLQNGLLSLLDVGDIGERATRYETGPVESRQHFADANGIAVDLGVTPCGASGRFLSEQRSGRHLSAGHTVNGVIDEYNGDIDASCRGVDDFRHTDGREVTVSLISKDDVVGIGEFDTRSHRGGSAVRGFLHIAVEILVRKHGAPDGRYTDDLAFEPEFFERLGNKSVGYAVSAPRAIMQRSVGEHLGFLEYDCHITPPCTRSPRCPRDS